MHKNNAWYQNIEAFKCLQYLTICHSSDKKLFFLLRVLNDANEKFFFFKKLVQL